VKLIQENEFKRSPSLSPPVVQFPILSDIPIDNFAPRDEPTKRIPMGIIRNTNEICINNVARKRQPAMGIRAAVISKCKLSSQQDLPMIIDSCNDCEPEATKPNIIRF
jgi:hypothetical protein